MFTSSQQLADARANARVFLALAVAGAIAGAAIGPAIYFKTLPAAAQQVVTPAYVANFNLARITAFSNQRWLETRISAYTTVPEIAQKLDEFPASVAAGAAGGALCLPLSLGVLISAIRRKKIPKKSDPRKSAVTDFLPRG